VRRLLSVTAGFALALSPLVTESSASAASAPSDVPAAGIYVVVLRAQPLSTYDGHIRGLAKTTPHAGHRFRADSSAVEAYRRHLVAGQARVLDALGDPPLVYSYTTAVDGFAVDLTSDQVTQVRSMRGVLSVDENTLAHLDSTGFSHSAASVPSSTSVPARAGHGVVVGVIDSGIWPPNPSFAGLPVHRRGIQRRYPGFTGTCQLGERWTRTLCNAKVIAARYFVKGFGRDNLAAVDFASPRDGNGHGSHTAAIAAGNAGVDATIEGQDFGHISGAAPGAALSIYKACWTAPDPRNDGCTTADTLKAIDAAVSDGVDVISYSIGSMRSSAGPVERAFVNATHAGVFIAASAGDEGPDASTVASHGPSVTTVAAAAGHAFRGAVVLGDGRRFVGSMVSDVKVASTGLVYAADAKAAGASSRRAALCYPGALDARAVDAAIVVCMRGGIARVSKSDSVHQAGGIAMVLLNTARGATNADVHAVPTVQLAKHDGLAVRSYVDSHRRNATAALRPLTTPAPGPLRVAGFSSRGPGSAGPADALKPDVAAPGVGIVSAVSPPADFGRLWDLASGTSMAAPQVAGFAADIMSMHPSWSPAAVKSALMTTAVPLRGGGPLAQGAGEVDLHRALDPGLVYKSRPAGPLNAASMAIGNLVARRTMSRWVTNVTRLPETYTARVTGLPGLGVSVAPATMTLAPGQSRRFTVTFTARRGARYGTFVGGALTWAGSRGHTATSPIVVRPSLVDAPPHVHVSGSHGTTTVSADAGVTGTLATRVIGPVAGSRRTMTLTPGVLTAHDPTRTATSWSRIYRVKPNTAAVRFEMKAKGHDVDVYVYRAGRLVSSAVSPSSHEEITVANPAPGRYAVYVDAVAASLGRHSIPAELTAWMLPRAAHGPHVTVVRRQGVTGGRAFTVAVGWTGLDPTRRWFAELRYRHSSALTYLTFD
jgi:hypothetical protein